MYKRYTKKEKATILERYLNGEKILTLAKETNISRTTIYAWISEQQNSTQNKRKVDFKYLHDLTIMHKRQKVIIEILQNSKITPLSPLKDRFEAIAQLSDKYNINTLCAAFKVAKGSYYNHVFRKKANTLNEQKQSRMTALIEEIYFEFNQIFGASKIYAILKYRGYAISERMVAKIMHQNGWFAVRSNSKKLYLQEQKIKKGNLLNRQFTVSRPNEVWVSDVTIFSCVHRKFYICVILDLYSRKVIAYSISNNNSTQLTKRTFLKALNSRSVTEPLMFHSDQGANYTSTRFMQTLKAHNVIQSLSQKGTPYDNSVMESFFKTLKCENLYRITPNSEKALKATVSTYIGFYNNHRPHTFLRNQTPEGFESLYYKKKPDVLEN